MSSLSSKFSAAETGVYWDLDDCPIPAGLTAVTISANIKLALENMGYTGNMSIFAYSVEKQSEEEFESAQIELMHRKTRQEKDRLMYLDILFWGIRHRGEPTNLMLISDDLLPKVNFVSGLLVLKMSENNILLTQSLYNPEKGLLLPDTLTSIWLWKSLATGGSPLVGHSMRSEPAPTCSDCIRRALRRANKRKERPTKPCLKRRKSSRSTSLNNLSLSVPPPPTGRLYDDLYSSGVVVLSSCSDDDSEPSSPLDLPSYHAIQLEGPSCPLPEADAVSSSSRVGNKFSGTMSYLPEDALRRRRTPPETDETAGFLATEIAAAEANLAALRSRRERFLARWYIGGGGSRGGGHSKSVGRLRAD